MKKELTKPTEPFNADKHYANTMLTLTQEDKKNLLRLLNDELTYFDSSSEWHENLVILRVKIEDSMENS